MKVNYFHHWEDGPHSPVDIENTWRTFIRSIGGTVLEDTLPLPRNFENADFFFKEHQVVAELKEIETEFSKGEYFHKKHIELLEKLVSLEPSWRPSLLGGTTPYPDWYKKDFIRIFRPPLQRILKKANKQIRETKSFLGIHQPTGIILLANDGFNSLPPNIARGLIAEILKNSFSSIDCCIYITINQYIALPDSNEPKLIWAPMYSDRANESLVRFVDKLGENWLNYLETTIGPFSSRITTESTEILIRSISLKETKNNEH